MPHVVHGRAEGGCAAERRVDLPVEQLALHALFGSLGLPPPAAIEVPTVIAIVVAVLVVLVLLAGVACVFFNFMFSTPPNPKAPLFCKCARNQFDIARGGGLELLGLEFSACGSRP